MRKKLLLAVPIGLVALGASAWRSREVQRLTGPARFVDLTAGAEHACLRHGDGRVACFGADANDALDLRGVAPNDSPDLHTAHWVPGAERAIEVRGGTEHGCLRQPEGAVLCWGFRPRPTSEAEMWSGGPARPNVLPRATPMLKHAAFLVQGGDALVVSKERALVGITESSPPWSILLPKAFDHLGRSLTTFSWKSLDADVVDYVVSSEHRCWRHADGRAECDSSGVTGTDGKPFASLDAPRQRVRSLGGSWFQTCFVLDDSAVQCRSTQGILDAGFPFAAEAAYASAWMVCALHDATLTCRDYAFPAPNEGRRAVTLGPLVDVATDVRAFAALPLEMCALHGALQDRVTCWRRSEEPSTAVALPE